VSGPRLGIVDERFVREPRGHHLVILSIAGRPEEPFHQIDTIPTPGNYRPAN
jgi:hypothetical protein